MTPKVENPWATTLAIMKADCERFQKLHGELIAGNLDQAGHDFWLTRNGHGAGFWDGDWSERGDTLTEICKYWPAIDLYLDDNGKRTMQKANKRAIRIVELLEELDEAKKIIKDFVWPADATEEQRQAFYKQAARFAGCSIPYEHSKKEETKKWPDPKSLKMP